MFHKIGAALEKHRSPYVTIPNYLHIQPTSGSRSHPPRKYFIHFMLYVRSFRVVTGRFQYFLWKIANIYQGVANSVLPIFHCEGRFFSDTFESFVGGALSGWLIFISRLSFIRMTISCFTVGNRGESTHGHARDVIGVDTDAKFSGIFFNVIFGSIVGGALSAMVISISRLSFIRLTISCFTVGNHGESTHGHARDVIG